MASQAKITLRNNRRQNAPVSIPVIKIHPKGCILLLLYEFFWPYSYYYSPKKLFCRFFYEQFWENYYSYSSVTFTHCRSNKDAALKGMYRRWQLPPMDDNRSKFQINSLISPSIWLRFQILFLLKTQNSKLHILTATFNQTKSIEI